VLIRILLILFLFLIITSFCISQNDNQSILIKKDTITNTDTTFQGLQYGNGPFNAEQDTLFNRLLNNNISFSALVNNGLMLSNDIWQLKKEISKGTPWQIALDNIRNIPREFFIPSGVEVVHRQVAIQSSQYIPYVNNMPQFSRFNINSILSFLGLVEDVSPEITYTIDFYADIEVVVYSVSSVVVATLFKGKQPPGVYKITWNGRDSNGKVMPSGDYIAEVRIGKEKYLRKRIIIR
jgi:hypothetical protein